MLVGSDNGGPEDTVESIVAADEELGDNEDDEEEEEDIGKWQSNDVLLFSTIFRA